MTLHRTRLGVVDLDELAAWNAANLRARDEYDRDPLAGARKLGMVGMFCARCVRGAHRLCSGRVGQHRVDLHLCHCTDGEHIARRVRPV